MCQARVHHDQNDSLVGSLPAVLGGDKNDRKRKVLVITSRPVTGRHMRYGKKGSEQHLESLGLIVSCWCCRGNVATSTWADRDVGYG